MLQRITIALTLVALAAAPMGCQKKDKGSKNPDDASESDKDPLEELKSIPDQIQAEIDTVMQPINDVDVVVEKVTTMPDRLGVDAAGLRAMMSASLTKGEVSINVNVGAEAKAEIEGVLNTVKGIGVGLKETPQRAATAGKNIVAIGAKSVGLVAKLTAKYQAKLKSPMLKADAKAKLQADLDSVMKLDADIKGMVSEAQTTVTSLPSKGTEALAKITAAFAS